MHCKSSSFLSFTRQNVFQLISRHFHKLWELIIRLLGLAWLYQSITENATSADASSVWTSPIKINLHKIQSASPSSSLSSNCSNTIQIRPAVMSYRHSRNLQVSTVKHQLLLLHVPSQRMLPQLNVPLKKIKINLKIFNIHSEIVPSTVWMFHAASELIHTIINIHGYLCVFGFNLIEKVDICYSISSGLIRNTTDCCDYLLISVTECRTASELNWDIPALSGS